MDAAAKNLAQDAARNPFFVFACTVLLSTILVYFAKSQETQLGEVWSAVINTIGAAVLTSGTFGLWFDYFGKRKLISEVVRDAIGQTKCLSVGITDFQMKVVDVDERQDFKSSNTIIVGTRRSSGVLDRYKDDIRTRLRSGKTLVIIMQEDASMFPTAQNYSSTPRDFVDGLEASEAGITANIQIFETKEIMSYNFVQSDRGIWVKLYFNAKQPDLPPALFANGGSPLHSAFNSDIDKLISSGKRVFP
ncbi:hypothetical protein [Novosphingobium naphthalenivorans]|uniref:hypothetical protein n=1 Tax=Novosphingobium naphthalenivorans TaxID=273168 RepID=UPI000AEB3224|nr:hypothetical protein [Novosphingobium naphthalenivorans]